MEGSPSGCSPSGREGLGVRRGLGFLGAVSAAVSVSAPGATSAGAAVVFCSVAGAFLTRGLRYKDAKKKLIRLRNHSRVIKIGRLTGFLARFLGLSSLAVASGRLSGASPLASASVTSPGGALLPRRPVARPPVRLGFLSLSLSSAGLAASTIMLRPSTSFLWSSATAFSTWVMSLTETKP